MREQEVSRDVQKELDAAAKRRESRGRELGKKDFEAKRRMNGVLTRPEKPKSEPNKSGKAVGECELCKAAGDVVPTEDGDFCPACLGKMPWLK